MSKPLLAAVVAVTGGLPGVSVEELARGVEACQSPADGHNLAVLMSSQKLARAAGVMTEAWKKSAQTTPGELAGMLRAASAARRAEAELGRVEVVVTGPSEHNAPTRSTAAVVQEVVDKAKYTLLLVTYSAVSYEPLLKLLAAALSRGVAVKVVIETVAGSQGMFNKEPALAFAKLDGIHLLEWPLAVRAGFPHGRLHAKVIVADGELAFITSANLTASAIEHNLECGVIVRAGSAPSRIVEHFAALEQAGVLRPLTAHLPV